MITKIGNTFFWVKVEKNCVGVRLSNSKNHTQPFEIGLERHGPCFSFYLYKEDHEDHQELRLSFRFLWLYLNVLLCPLTSNQPTRLINDDDQSWGWEVIDDCLVLEWGARRNIWYLPFRFRHFIRRMERERTFER